MDVIVSSIMVLCLKSLDSVLNLGDITEVPRVFLFLSWLMAACCSGAKELSF